MPTRTRLPRAKTKFFGREEDRARLAVLRAEGASLVTLWGPPGIGKTRLALELCRAARDDAIGFCELATARSVADICARVLSALGVEAPETAHDPRWVGALLAERGPGLLVLDELEHLTAFAAATVGVWTELAPELFVVVTSRERLGLPCEITHEVLPLGEAAELFVDRVTSRTRFASLDAADVAAIVELLERIPLAIELAAARVDVLGVAGLRSRLARPLDVLDRAQDGPDASRTLRAAIDSSFRLLARAEQRVLAQCASFRGEFSLDDAAAVVRCEPGACLLDALHRLRDRSLLRCVSRDGEVRFAFFESIRAYAESALDAEPDAREVRRRHARHAIDAARDAANLEAAVGFALEDDPMRPEVGRALDALARLEPSVLAGPLAVHLERALELAIDVGPTRRARARRARGRALFLEGRADDARAEIERARTLATEDAALTGALWADLGVVHHQLRDMDRARACYEAALEAHRDGGDLVARARCLGNLAAIDHDLRRLDAALPRYEEAIAGFRAAGEERLEGIFLGNLAVALQELGMFERARATYTLALERLERAGDRRLEAITRTNLGTLCHEQGELEEARVCHESALALFRRVTDVRSEALCNGRLAMALAALGAEPEAVDARLARATRLAGPLGDATASELVDLFRAYVELARTGDATLARERLRHARPLQDCSDDARTAVRLVETELARAGVARGVLRVGPGASWFTPPSGATHDLSSRHVLRRLLLRLVQSHRESPGQGLTLDALRDAGWPGERAIPEAALNRVHVALSELRRRGLRECFVKREDGYLLDPAIRVEIAAAARSLRA